MKALFLGGTGTISTAVSKLAIERGWELTILNRGKSKEFLPDGAEFIQCDINDDEKLREILSGRHFDTTVQWIGFTPERVKADIELLRGKTNQHIFISSCAAYERPMRRYIVTEDAPLNNTHWQYGRDKAACEDVLTASYRTEGFPFTVVRPSYTYGNLSIPHAMNGNKPWSIVSRMLAGKPVIVHGDGLSLWSMTHNTDFAKGFVGLMGRSKAVGEAYNIVSDEILTWDEITYAIGAAAGVKPAIVHMSSEQIIKLFPNKEGDLLGDKATSVIVDCSKLKALVPDFVCTTPFERGIKITVDYFNAHPELKTVDEAWNADMDKLIEANNRI
ncbi:hypothetical protein FACS189490_03670 [Clostridia bacterium]|nr:hypothetical protein FACS189490_03650 [Clostridia bacterium]GHV39674.1 hypothetical protein FACS189490_03670 [Clostridia bacterium]